MEELKIELFLNDWLYNSGIVGFVNILKNYGDDVEYDGYKVTFNPNVLENFEEKYFKYFFDAYKSTLAWSKVVGYESVIEYHEKDNYQNFNEQSLELLNKYTKDAKNKIEDKSHIAAYALVDSDFDPEVYAKKFKNIKI